MSSTVNIDMCLIASKNLLPIETMHSIFLDTLNELNGEIKNDTLFINNKKIGTIYLKDRILIRTVSELAQEVTKATEKLRTTFSRRAQVEIDNYTYYLKKEKERIEKAENNIDVLQKDISAIDKKIEDNKKAIARQSMSSCEAIVEELKEAALNQGYDIEEEKTNNGVQLQFVRRVY